MWDHEAKGKFIWMIELELKGSLLLHPESAL